MDNEARRFREARQRASEAAFDFLTANPHCAGVVIVSGGVAVYRNKTGNERLINQSQETTHGQPV